MWSATLCMCIHKNSIRRHAKGARHLGAVELETHRVTAERDGAVADLGGVPGVPRNPPFTLALASTPIS